MGVWSRQAQRPKERRLQAGLTPKRPDCTSRQGNSSDFCSPRLSGRLLKRPCGLEPASSHFTFLAQRTREKSGPPQGCCENLEVKNLVNPNGVGFCGDVRDHWASGKGPGLGL